MASLTRQDELIDDSKNDNPVEGLKGSASLKDRFTFRLSRLLGRNVTVKQITKEIRLHIGPLRGAATSTATYDKRIREFARDLQATMRRIARSTDENEDAISDLWDVVLVYASPNIHEIVMSLKRIFEENKNRFDAMVARVCGLDDVYRHGSSHDTVLGDRIIRVQGLTNSYQGSLSEQHELIDNAWKIIQEVPNSDVRLKSLLGGTFSTRVYDQICKLSHPMSTNHTITRAARSNSAFQSVNVCLDSPRPPPPPSSKAMSPASKNTLTKRQPQRVQPRTSPTTKRLYPPPPPPPPPPPHQGTMMETIWRYLPKADHGLGLLRLQPLSKQAAALLIGCLLHNIAIPPGSDTYYIFGFVTCRDEQEERALADHYRLLLQTTLAPTTVFKGILDALEYHTLMGLLRNRTNEGIKTITPALNHFLTTPPA
ncbi:hypothetical protein C7974DRAFT_447082 [Boeremia exigua]|uniref:uncharacterized protein n=1 Tax=Boeremia exigua TaxID=749465 RepID=UPI001E8D1B85|nr:uncharacterized protein C7974DRAFT_447082 [Boeremia exigua]KAH6642492.1 hypothetical protein C7974DRAFT_447082 [Boeremia exigua]